MKRRSLGTPLLTHKESEGIHGKAHAQVHSQAHGIRSVGQETEGGSAARPTQVQILLSTTLARWPWQHFHPHPCTVGQNPQPAGLSKELHMGFDTWELASTHGHPTGMLQSQDFK